VWYLEGRGSEPRATTVMSITLHLAPETERVLKEKAARAGQTLESYIEGLAEREARGTNGVPTDARGVRTALDELLAPVRKEFEESGMTEEELTEFLTEVRDEVRREKRARKDP
jgi:hypothetical protein